MSKQEELQHKIAKLEEGQYAESVNLLQELALLQLEEEEKLGDAIETLEQAIGLCSHLPDGEKTKLEADLRYDLARAYSNNEKPEEARQNAELALKLYQSTNIGNELAKVRHRLALISILDGNTDAAFDDLETAQQLAEENKNKDVLANIYATKGDLNSLLQNNTEALENYRMASKQYEENGNFSAAGNACMLISQILEKHGSAEQAAQGYLTAVETYMQANDHDHAGLCYRHLAKLYDRKSDYDNAIEHYQLAAKAFEKSENFYQVADNYYQAGYMYEEQKQWQNAIDCFEQALPHAQAAEDEVLTDTITDSMEHAREKMEAESKQNTKKSGGGLFGKIKDIFGGA